VKGAEANGYVSDVRTLPRVARADDGRASFADAALRWLVERRVWRRPPRLRDEHRLFSTTPTAASNTALKSSRLAAHRPSHA